MLDEVGLEFLLLFGLRVILFLFDLITSICSLLVSLYANLALWSQETQHSVVQAWQCLHRVDLGLSLNGVKE